MAAPVFEELFEYPIEKFKAHLLDDSNTRILFSGKYGIGKTMFLNAFFDPESQKKTFGEEKFAYYRLSPVNYSIAASEDIVDYIKYDIILEFLRKGQDFETKDFTYLDTLPSYLKKNLLSVAKVLVSMIPKVGKEVVKTHEEIMKLWEEFEKYAEAANTTDGDKLSQYVSTIEGKAGSPYVNDIVTKIIQHVVHKKGTDSVLIIDDLDRLDPEHIFRLLNIFSVHLGDHPTEVTGNKFGFKKLIIVCDYNNIRHLFNHRYGPHTDFAGYIDKFYSTSVFHFDNRAAIVAVIQKVFASFTYPTAADEKFAASVLVQDKYLYDILAVFVETRFISLRNIIKQYERAFDLHDKPITYGTMIAPFMAFHIRIACNWP